MTRGIALAAERLAFCMKIRQRKPPQALQNYVQRENIIDCDPQKTYIYVITSFPRATHKLKQQSFPPPRQHQSNLRDPGKPIPASASRYTSRSEAEARQ